MASASNPAGVPSSSTRPESRSSAQPDRSISAATTIAANASARSKPVSTIAMPDTVAATDP